MKRRSIMFRNLPGPLPGEHENIAGHLGGDLIVDDPNMPFSNLLDNIAKNMVKGLSKMIHIRQFGDPGLIRLYALSSNVPLNHLGMVVLHDIDFCRQLLSYKNRASSVKGKGYVTIHQLIGDGVLSSSGEQWEKQRPILERAFKHEIIGMALPNITKSVEECITKLNKKIDSSGAKAVTIDLHEEMLKLTMDVIGRVGFGYDFNSITANTTGEAPLFDTFATIFEVLFERVFNPIMKATYFLPTSKNIRLNSAFDKLGIAVNKIILERINLRKVEIKMGINVDDVDLNAKGKNIRNKDLLDFLLEAQGNNIIDHQLIADNMQTVLFAGHDTTAAALSWFIYLLSLHPEAADKIRKEVDTIVGKDNIPDYDQLEKLDYLNACLYEVLRLYPSAAFSRTLTEDVTFGDHVVPTGTEVFLFPYIIHRDPKYYPYKPNEFVPERWLPNGQEYPYMGQSQNSDEPAGTSSINSRAESAQTKVGKYSMTRPYLPFSLGHRNCVGRPLAFAEIRVSVIALIRQFDFTAVTDLKFNPGFQTDPIMQLTLNPNSLIFKVQKRQN